MTNSKNYVKEYKGYRVPEGASHVIHNDIDPTFYKKVDINPEIFIVNTNTWAKLPIYAEFGAAIELPLSTKIEWDSAPSDDAVWIVADDSRISSGWFHALSNDGVYKPFKAGDLFWSENPSHGTVHHRPVEDKPAEWDGEGLPPIGCECEVFVGGWVKCNVEFIGVVFVVYTTHSGEHINKIDTKFRPLKTQEEKEREAFHLAVIDACMGIHKDDFNIDEIASVLFHSGFKAPEGK